MRLSPDALETVHRTFETLRRFINLCCKSPLALGISLKLKLQTGQISLVPGRLGKACLRFHEYLPDIVQEGNVAGGKRC